MKKLFAIFVLLSVLFCIAGCQSTKSPPTKSDLAVRYGIEESKIDDYHQKYPKIMGLPSKEDEFAEDRVIIGVYQFAYQYDFTPEDFSEIPCKSVNPLIGPYEGSENPSRFLVLELKTRSKEQLIKAIEILQQRADIYCAEVDYIVHVS